MSDDLREQQRPAERVARWAAPRWLWFGVLGGSVAWGVHLLAAWSVVELGCAYGSVGVLGLSLRGMTVVFTAIPAVVAALAWVAAWRSGRILARAQDDPPPGVLGRRLDRARFLAEVGTWLDAFSLLMIILGAVAVGVFGACAR